jgi:hypothetical protein
MCSRFYTAHELFKIAREQGRYQNLCMEFGPNLYQPIHSDNDLRFVCCLLEGEIEANFTDDERWMNADMVADTAHTDACEHGMHRGARKKNHRTKDPERRRTLPKSSAAASPHPAGVFAHGVGMSYVVGQELT